MARTLENWIDKFLEYSATIPSPELFKKWAAIATISGALERRIWVDVGMGPLYPNIYTFLISPPGVGKSAMTSIVRNMWTELKDEGLNVAPASPTAASLIDSLQAAERKIFAPDNPLEPIRFNSLAVCSNELGVFLPAYDPMMMNVLTDLYDGHGYSERRRWMRDTKDADGINIPNPSVSIVAATTPSYMTGMLPDGAWDQGFLSRTILVFSGERVVQPLFQSNGETRELRNELIEDLKDIFRLYGEVSFTSKAKDAIIAWHMAGGPPAPDHPRLTNYNTRRTSHLLKLSMIASVAAGNERKVTIDHFNRALDWLLEAEVLMPDIFKAMVVNADSKAMDECWHFAYQLYLKEAKPIAEVRIINFLKERVPIHNVMRMLQVMCSAGILEEQVVGGVGKAYKPKARRR